MLTHHQKNLLEFIVATVDAEGIPPTVEEMKEAMGLRAKSGVIRLLRALDERGFIRRIPNKARAIEVIRRPVEPADKYALAVRRFHKDVASLAALIGADIAEIAGGVQ